MKSECIHKQKESEYPFLGFHEEGNFIVLFSARNVGTVVWVGENCSYAIGEHTRQWSNDFIRFNDSIVLSN